MSRNLEEFLERNNIYFFMKEDKDKEIRDIKSYDEKEYIEVLRFCHKVFIEEKNSGEFKLRNDIFKRVEFFKLWNRRVNRILDKDNLVSKALELSKNSLNKICEVNYRDIIRRAMERQEVCVGKIYYKNSDKSLYVYLKSLEDIKFNLIEDDYYTYLKRIRGEKRISIEDLIKDICLKEDLDYKSYVYINSLINYPMYSMKYLQECYIKNLKPCREVLEEALYKDLIIS